MRAKGNTESNLDLNYRAKGRDISDRASTLFVVFCPILIREGKGEKGIHILSYSGGSIGLIPAGVDRRELEGTQQSEAPKKPAY